MNLFRCTSGQMGRYIGRGLVEGPWSGDVSNYQLLGQMGSQK